MNPSTLFPQYKQSLWYDNIQRCLLENGELAAMVNRGDIRGVTSNPSIFLNAIAKTDDYDSALVPMAWAGWEAETIFWQLAVDDIRHACDLFRPLYDETGGADGYVSLEVHPALAHDTKATFAQAKHLWGRVDRPNLMIKIPATKEGLPALRAAIAVGINVNVTLIFSIDRYREVMEAYLSGLEERLLPSPFGGGGGSEVPASVASFFVSRMDTKVDNHLPKDSPLRGKAAIANAKLAYAAFRETFTGPRWENLAKAGARLQRPLWASTSTKNPAYPDTLYVDSLIGPDTVNTVPPLTLEAFRDHGTAAETLTIDLDHARQVFSELESLDISIANVTRELEEEGVQAFADAFSAMLSAIEARRAAVSLGSLSTPVKQRIARLEEEAVASRLWDGDPSLWTADPKSQVEIRERLGWLSLPVLSRSRISEISSFIDDIRSVGIRKFLLLGMGGSSLAPEVLSLVFPSSIQGETKDGSAFAILDSTDPAQVIDSERKFPLSETLYIVSSKSGDTVETMAAFYYFWNQAGRDGMHFAAITDPGTTLDVLADAGCFRKTLLADPNVGGRFSVLADYGLLPMALMGMDIAKVLDSANEMMRLCRAETSAASNPGLALGAVLGEAALAGRDKLTFIADPPVAAFSSWLEQLIAESSGKQGKGIIVVDGEPVGKPSDYRDDRLFVYLKVTGEQSQALQVLKEAGHPVLEFHIPDRYALAAEFYRWEIATAVACHILGVNAFDQPDVQDNKTRTVNKMSEYGRTGKLDEPRPIWEHDGIKAITNQDITEIGLETTLAGFISLANKGDYVAINAYLPRNAKMLAALTRLRLKVRERTGCATTLGFGPRFLHSTGQLHKGGPDSGLFLQITADPVEDIEIPDQGKNSEMRVTFSILERAQALGDYEALVARGRRVLRLHLPVPGAVGMISDALK